MRCSKFLFSSAQFRWKSACVESLQPLLAPISAGQRIGALKITLDGKPFRELPVVALESVPLAGILGRGWDSIRLLFKNL